jgi:tetratricopeptide (TPR) repeat protein/SAM-dependent methyltransferase
MPDDVEQVFGRAIGLHQNGQLTQAETLYRQVLAAAPDHLDALNLFGVLALQTGRSELAVELIGKAIALNDKVPDFHNNIGEAFRRLGRLDEAIAHFTKAVDLEPGFGEALHNLANMLNGQGRLDEAAEAYSRMLRLKPDSVPAHRGLANIRRRQARFDEAVKLLQQAVNFAPGSAQTHNDLAIALREHGRLDDAIGHFQRALALEQNFPEAHSNLGNALRERGELAAAAGHLENALALKPNFPAALHNLALVRLAAGRHEQALTSIIQALGSEESEDTKAQFVRCLREDGSLGAAPHVRPFLLRALSEPWGRPSELVNAAVNAITSDAAAKELMSRAPAGAADATPSRECVKDPAFATLAGDELLRCLLEAAPITHPGLERLLTSLRSALLQTSLEGPQEPWPDFAFAFFCALARQCFINEYVFALSDAERERSDALCGALSAALRAQAAVPAWRVVTAACYRPLHSIEFADKLLAMSWPEAVDGLLTQQLREPAAVARCRAAIPRLTAIDDAVSVSVRQQYEESPYPRWVKTPPVEAWATLDGYLRNLFPQAAFASTNKRDGEILIAGCGTGQQSIETARRFPHARVLAVDLSLASLAYAQAKTEAAGVAGIRYAQADILKIGDLDQTFDFIETTGVLHHLNDPFAGWRVLLSKLRPAGFMRVGLYSRLARQEVQAARAWIAQRHYRATVDDIRRCRQDMIAAHEVASFRWLGRSPDFASTSACRDLLFHVHERELTLLEIDAFVAEEKLSFLGFELESHLVEQYRARFPHDPTMSKLDLCHRFEVENRNTFADMYQFWIQKPA